MFINVEAVRRLSAPFFSNAYTSLRFRTTTSSIPTI